MKRFEVHMHGLRVEAFGSDAGIALRRAIDKIGETRVLNSGTEVTITIRRMNDAPPPMYERARLIRGTDLTPGSHHNPLISEVK